MPALPHLVNDLTGLLRPHAEAGGFTLILGRGLPPPTGAPSVPTAGLIWPMRIKDHRALLCLDMLKVDRCRSGALALCSTDSLGVSLTAGGSSFGEVLRLKTCHHPFAGEIRLFKLVIQHAPMCLTSLGSLGIHFGNLGTGVGLHRRISDVRSIGVALQSILPSSPGVSRSFWACAIPCAYCAVLLQSLV